MIQTFVVESFVLLVCVYFAPKQLQQNGKVSVRSGFNTARSILEYLQDLSNIRDFLLDFH